MKCPVCNNNLTVKELGGKKYLLCTNCKKVYNPSDFAGNQNTHTDNVVESPRMALSLCSMVLGIIGLLLSCIWIGVFPAVIGLILAIIALVTHQSKGMAIAGLVTSLIGITIAAIVLITGIAVNDVLEERGLTSSDGSKKESVKKDSEDPENPSEQEEQTLEPEQPEDDNMINLDTGEYIIKYTGHAVGTDYEGNPCLLVYYDFTNNSDKNTSALASSYIRTFQNGVECGSAFFSQENEAIDNYSKDIQPGVTINVAQSFKISDMSDATIEASEFLSLDDIKDTMTIQLQ